MKHIIQFQLLIDSLFFIRMKGLDVDNDYSEVINDVAIESIASFPSNSEKGVIPSSSTEQTDFQVIGFKLFNFHQL